MSSEEYDLKKSEDKVGQLYPVLLSKDGKVIDGLHRLKSDKGWRTETLEHIDDEEKLLVARCVSNWHRRSVPVSEKEDWINGLALIYQKQGLKSALRHTDGGLRNEIKEKIMEITGLSDRTILRHLSPEFKQVAPPDTTREPRVPASQVIRTMEKSMGYKPGTLVERHREEVKEEVREEVKEEVVAEVREEALRDPEFVVKAIEKAPEVLTKRPVPTVDRERYHVPTVDREAQAEAEQVSEEVDKVIKATKEAPEIREKAKLLRAWRALGVMLSQSEGLICPICDGVVAAYLKCPNCGDIPIAEAARIARDAIE